MGGDRGHHRRPEDARDGDAARLIVGLTIIAAAVPLTPAALDETMLIKAAAVLVGVGLVVGLTLGGGFAGSSVPLPTGGVTWALVGFTIVVLAATIWSPTPLLSFVGSFERYTGGLVYAACAALAAAVMVWLPTGDGPGAVPWVLAGSVGVAFYGLLQAVGLDPVSWAGRFGDDVIAQFGNPDFVSGYFGIVMPLAVWAALWSGWRFEVRLLAGTLAVTMVVLLVGTGAAQGWVAAVGGTSVLIVAVAASRAGRPRWVWSGAGVLGAAVMAVIALGAAGSGPAARLWGSATVRSRGYLWQTALEMIQAEPVTGVGLGRFGRYYHEFRPLDEAVRRDLDRAADAAHNVFLDLAAGGGLPVAIAWLGLVVVVVVSLGRTWRADADPGRRILVGALGGAYLGYHLQAAVSLDVPPLAVLHFVLVGAIASAAPGTRVRWAQLRPDTSASGLRRWLYAGAIAGPVIVIVAVVVVADHAAGSGAAAGARDESQIAVSRIELATTLAPWQPEYHFEYARALAGAGRLEPAVVAMDAVLERDPRDLAAWISRARLLEALERPLAAVEAYTSAREIAPKSPELGVEYAEALIEVGQRTHAREVLIGVVAAVPDYGPALDLLDDL